MGGKSWGQADAVVLLTTRSNDHGELGFVSDPNRLNVALSRARHHLVILGDLALLRGDRRVWGPTLRHAEQAGLRVYRSRAAFAIAYAEKAPCGYAQTFPPPPQDDPMPAEPTLDELLDDDAANDQDLPIQSPPTPAPVPPDAPDATAALALALDQIALDNDDDGDDDDDDDDGDGDDLASFQARLDKYQKKYDKAKKKVPKDADEIAKLKKKVQKHTKRLDKAKKATK